MNKSEDDQAEQNDGANLNEIGHDKELDFFSKSDA